MLRYLAMPRLAIFCAALALAACTPPVPTVSRSIALPPVSPASSTAATPPAESFAAFIANFRSLALAAGVSAQTYDNATAGIAPIAQIQPLNAAQPEFTRPIWSYLDSAVSPTRIAGAQQLLIDNQAMLQGIEDRYGVPKEILVAIWGMETDYGRDTGSFPLFSALATLAWTGPRTDYARPEFLAALKMEQQQNYPQTELLSSWAGAFGQTQFTPSTFLKYAVDGDGDGHIDLWHSSADALASTAAMLAASGWERGKVWGYEIALPKNFAYEDADIDNAKPLAEWRARGVTAIMGAPLPVSDEDGAIYLPAGAGGPAFMVFPNFKVILKYNNAASYALGVALLADAARGMAPVIAAWPRDEAPLTRDERFAFQNELRTLGFDPGPTDGVLGRKTRAALRLYQKSRGLPADGWATLEMLYRMKQDIKP